MSRARLRVTLKLATSLDGRIALASGASQWITGDKAREAVHTLRAAHDVVLTGSGTVLADDPAMTARPGGKPARRQPRRVVLDSTLSIPPGAALFGQPGGGPVIIFATRPDPLAREALETSGAEVHLVEPDAEGRPGWSGVLEALEAMGAGSVMIEAGGRIAASAIAAGVVDRIEWFRAPKLIGGDGLPAIAALGLEALASAPTFRRVKLREVGDDLWESYERGAG